MHHDMLMDLSRRLLLHVQQGTTDMALTAYREPVENYISIERFERERRTLFWGTPFVAGLSCELRHPGDHKTIDVAGKSLLLVRSSGGEVRAFLNVCRHRGTRLVEGRGNCSRFSCPFHAWTYNTEGTLVTIPSEEGFSGVDRTSLNLSELPVVERHGLIFARASHGELDLSTHLHGLGADLAAWDFASYHHIGTRTLRVQANWKLVMDTYTESYHIPFLHRKTLAAMVCGNAMTHDTYGPHQRLGFAVKSIRQLTGVPEEQWEPRAHVTPVYLVFPNTALLTSGSGFLMLSQIFPGQGPADSVSVHTFFSTAPPGGERERAILEGQFKFLTDPIHDEDYPLAAGTQHGLQTGANTHLTFGRNEPSLHHLHASYEAALAPTVSTP